MIRLHIERIPEHVSITSPHADGLLWFKNGRFVGRAIIEAWNGKYPVDSPLNWVPVEVIDES